MDEIEKSFRCPYCREQISMILDLSSDGDQSYIEDCEVCCKPIQITFKAENSTLASFSASRAN